MGNSINHILFIDPSPEGKKYGGSTICLIELLQELDKVQWAKKITILFLYPNVVQQHLEQIHNISTKSLFTGKKLHTNNRITNYLQKLKKYFLFFIFILSRKDIELIVINSRIGSGRFAILFGKIFKISVVVHERLETKITRLNRWIASSVMVITMSDYLRRLLISQGIRSEKVITIYDGLKISNDIVLSDKNKRHNKIIMVGNVIPWKGQHIFVESFKFLKSKNVEYYLAGSIFDKEYYNSFSGTIDNKHIFYKGFITDIINEIKKYDIVVHASQKPEPFGRTIIEAMSVGVPVIAANTGGPLESIEHMKTGLHFQYDSPKDLAEKIDLLLSDHKLNLSIQKKAYQIVKEKFNIEISSVKILNEYKKVLIQ